MTLQFLKFGMFTFGGGWSIVAQMQEKYVEQEKLLSNSQLVDITSVGRSLPGAMICNVAMIFGYRFYGLTGGLLCVIALTIPPLILLSVFALLYESILSNQWLNAAFFGIRSAVAPIIFVSTLKMCSGSFEKAGCITVCALCFVLFSIFKVGCIPIIAAGAIMGFIICEVNERRAFRKR